MEFKTAEETGKSFPETAIRVKPNQSVAFDPNDAALREKVKNQKNVTELFPELTYDELAAVMETWLNAGTEEAAEPAATEETPETPAKPVVSATAKAAVKAPASTKEIADEFANLFDK